MEKLIDAILKLIPFADWLQSMGLGKETSAGLSVVNAAAFVSAGCKEVAQVDWQEGQGRYFN